METEFDPRMALRDFSCIKGGSFVVHEILSSKAHRINELGENFRQEHGVGKSESDDSCAFVVFCTENKAFSGYICFAAGNRRLARNTSDGFVEVALLESPGTELKRLYAQRTSTGSLILRFQANDNFSFLAHVRPEFEKFLFAR